MPVLDRVRRLVNGKWKYVTADESGGGSQPVSCVIQAHNQDLASASPYYVLWGTDGEIYDNWIDQNELEALPEGIGLELNSDNLTTTEAGVWALSLDYAIVADAIGVIATWEGFLSLDNFSQVGQTFKNQNVNPEPEGTPQQSTASADKHGSLCEIVALPAGAQIATRVDTLTPAATETLESNFDLSIVRLA